MSGKGKDTALRQALERRLRTVPRFRVNVFGVALSEGLSERSKNYYKASELEACGDSVECRGVLIPITFEEHRSKVVGVATSLCYLKTVVYPRLANACFEIEAAAGGPLVICGDPRLEFQGELWSPDVVERLIREAGAWKISPVVEHTQRTPCPDNCDLYVPKGLTLTELTITKTTTAPGTWIELSVPESRRPGLLKRLKEKLAEKRKPTERRRPRFPFFPWRI